MAKVKLSQLPVSSEFPSSGIVAAVSGGVTKAIVRDGIPSSVKTYGAKGDGVTDDSNAINLNIAALGATGGALIFLPGTYVLQSVYIPSNCTLVMSHGAKISIPATKTILIDGTIDAGPHPIFTGLGSVNTDTNMVVFPEWWDDYDTGEGEGLYRAYTFFSSSVGGTIKLQAKYYVSPWYTDATKITKPNIRIIGSKMPLVATDKTRLDPSSGTILARTVRISANNPTVKDLGIDSGSWVCANLPVDNYAGDGADGLIFIGGSTLKLGAHVENVQTLCKSPSVTYHGVLFERYDNVTALNLNTLYGVHGVAVKSRRVNISGIRAIGHNFDGLIIKCENDLSIDCSDVFIDNVFCSSDVAEDFDGAGVLIQAFTGTLNRIRLSSVTCVDVKWALQAYPNTNTAFIRDCIISGMFIRNANAPCTVKGTGGFNIESFVIDKVNARDVNSLAFEFSHTRESILRCARFFTINDIGVGKNGIWAHEGNYHLQLQDIYVSDATSAISNTNGSTFPVFVDGIKTDLVTTDLSKDSPSLYDGMFTFKGVYTPIAANVGNCSSLTAILTSWVKNDNYVTCRGSITVGTSTGNSNTAFDMTLPYPSDFTANTDASGVAISYNSGQSMGVYANASNNRVVFQNESGWTNTSAILFSFEFTYLVK